MPEHLKLRERSTLRSLGRKTLIRKSYMNDFSALKLHSSPASETLLSFTHIPVTVAYTRSALGNQMTTLLLLTIESEITGSTLAHLLNCLKQLVIGKYPITRYDTPGSHPILRWTEGKFGLPLVNMDVGKLIYFKQ